LHQEHLFALGTANLDTSPLDFCIIEPELGFTLFTLNNHETLHKERYGNRTKNNVIFPFYKLSSIPVYNRKKDECQTINEL
jgi:hypothetical protein